MKNRHLIKSSMIDKNRIVLFLLPMDDSTLVICSNMFGEVKEGILLYYTNEVPHWFGTDEQ